ncbi:hypothetical protein Nmel_013807 [Mimus melanotis]
MLHLLMNHLAKFPWKPLIGVLEVKASSGVCGSLKAAGLDLPLHQCCRSSRAEAGLGNLGNHCSGGELGQSKLSV